MKNQSFFDGAQSKRSLIMKVGSAVLGIHIAAVCVFALTQGCVTTESQGSGRGAGARHKGPWKHEHKGKAVASTPVAQDIYATDSSSIYDPVIIDTTDTSTAPEPYVAPTAETQTYIVQKGDILSQLAVDFNTSTKNLIALNNLADPDVLYVGQELLVPAGSVKSPSPSSTSRPAVKKGGTYVIQKGDTLSEIAAAAGVSINELRELNNISGDQIFAGDTIDIPAHGKVPSIKRESKPKKSEPAPQIEPAPAATDPEPAPMATEPMVEPVETASMSVDAVMDHVVYPGETLDDISRQYGVSKSEIMRLNNISDETAVQEGQRLRIPIAE